MFFFNFPGRGMREVGLCHPPVIFMRPWALNYLELPCLSSPPSFPKENGQVLLLLQFPNSKPMIPRKKLEIFLSKTLLQSDRPPLETDIPLRNRIIMSKQEERTRVFFRFSFLSCHQVVHHLRIAFVSLLLSKFKKLNPFLCLEKWLCIRHTGAWDEDKMQAA